MSFIASLTDFNTLSPSSLFSPERGITKPILILLLACELKLIASKNIINV